jgi:hypothetical protein
LFNNLEFKGWAVRHSIPGSIDSVDFYLIIEMHSNNFRFEHRKEVLVSGYCYHIPKDKLRKKGIEYPAGTEWYYILVTDIK